MVSEVMAVGVPPRSLSCIPAGIRTLECHHSGEIQCLLRMFMWLLDPPGVLQAGVGCTQLVENVPAHGRGLDQVTLKGSFQPKPL